MPEAAAAEAAAGSEREQSAQLVRAETEARDLEREVKRLRADVAGGIPESLLSLYDRIRTQTGTTGAALLKARQCQGCRIELNGRELAAVRGTDPHEVVRCENCGRILVRNAESGL